MLKSTAILLPSCGGFQHCHCLTTSSQVYTLTGSDRSSFLSRHRPRGERGQCRSFADVKSSQDRSVPHRFEWPSTSSSTAVPSPYEIFKLAPDAPYSKARFYELVKIYHPDKHSGDSKAGTNSLPQAVRLERYRLIVAANDILCDPQKRRNYDQYGSGWAGTPEAGSWSYEWSKHRQTKWSENETYRSCAGNATWEDWEKWRQEHRGGRKSSRSKQQPIFSSNGGFMILIVVFAMLGGIGEMTRMGNMSRSFIKQLDAIHDDSSKDFMRRRRESLESNGMDERVHNFLTTRDPSSLGLDSREGRPARIMPPENSLKPARTRHA